MDHSGKPYSCGLIQSMAVWAVLLRGALDGKLEDREAVGRWKNSIGRLTSGAVAASSKALFRTLIRLLAESLASGVLSETSFPATTSSCLLG
jgi:hypothetical protein